jgi:hypothetical protein
MKFLVPNYSCLHNSRLGDYHPQIPVLCPLSTEFVEHPCPPTKILGTPLGLSNTNHIYFCPHYPSCKSYLCGTTPLNSQLFPSTLPHTTKLADGTILNAHTSWVNPKFVNWTDKKQVHIKPPQLVTYMYINHCCLLVACEPSSHSIYRKM